MNFWMEIYNEESSMTVEKKFVLKSSALVIGIVAIIVVIGLALVTMSIGTSRGQATDEPVNVLSNSTDDCMVCHDRNWPGIVQQYGHSAIAAADVTCRDCREVGKNYPGSKEHEGTFVLN